MNVDTWRDFIYRTEIGGLALSQSNNWLDPYFDGSYDDAGVGSRLALMIFENVTKGGYSGRYF